jgi:molybdopterin converting factor small subunit
LTALAGGDRPRCVLLTPGDHPGITPQLVGQIIACAIQIPDRIVIPCVSGQRGHPIALPWAIATLIHSLPRGAGVNAVVAAHAQTISELVLSDPQILADLDTPEDLALYQDRLALFRLPVRLFALAKDRAGCPEVEVELRPGSTVADLRAALVARVPAIGPLVATALIAVDDEYAGDHVPVRPGSRLAVIPPVSGGTAPASRCRHPSGRGTRRP